MDRGSCLAVHHTLQDVKGKLTLLMNEDCILLGKISLSLVQFLGNHNVGINSYARFVYSLLIPTVYQLQGECLAYRAANVHCQRLLIIFRNGTKFGMFPTLWDMSLFKRPIKQES